MITVYGMSERIGQLAFPKEEGQWPSDRPYSDATAQAMDEVRKATLGAKRFSRHRFLY